jgi:hypothetical protein
MRGPNWTLGCCVPCLLEDVVGWSRDLMQDVVCVAPSLYISPGHTTCAGAGPAATAAHAAAHAATAAAARPAATAVTATAMGEVVGDASRCSMWASHLALPCPYLPPPWLRRRPLLPGFLHLQRLVLRCPVRCLTLTMAPSSMCAEASDVIGPCVRVSPRLRFLGTCSYHLRDPR